MEGKTPFEVSIPRYKEVLEGSKPVVYYLIEVQKRVNEKWEIEKRYKEFSLLADSLKKMHPNIPSLPGKSLLKLKDPKDIDNRRAGLEKFVRGLVARQDTLNNESFKKFLQLDNFAPETTVHPPKLLGELTGPVYGIRDFHYEADKGLMFLAHSDMQVTSRVDSYFSNMKKPWEKDVQAKSLATVAAVECYIQSDLGQIKFEKLWTKTFQHQVIVLYWDQASSLLIVGEDDGKITVLKVLAELNYIKYEEVTSYKLHLKRVMGVYVDSVTNLAYSVGEDKKFKVFDYDRNEIISEEMPGNSDLTGLIVDKETKRAFISSKQGAVFIYDISTTQPRVIHCLQTHPKGNIRGLSFDSTRNYLLTGNFDDGVIALHDLTKPGKEKYAYQIASLQGKPKVRTITWSNNRQEVYSGNQDGTITFWNVKKVSPIFVLKAADSAICKVDWFENKSLLLTASKDKKIKFWQLPDEWRDREVEAEEERNYRQMKESESIMKIQKSQQKGDDSDDDDLVGWNN